MRAKKANSTKNIYKAQETPRFKKRFSNQGPSNAPRVNKRKVSSPKPQEEKGGRSYVEKPLSAKCDKRDDGKSLLVMGDLYGCGKSGDMKRDFPMMEDQRR